MEAHVRDTEKAIFNDERGSHVKFFGKTPEKLLLEDVALKEVFMTVNHKGTLRGLHFQVNPPQPKLLTCVTGSAQVVTVCLDPESDDFGKWNARLLSGDLTTDAGAAMVFVPPLHALGYLILEEGTRMLYMAGEDFSASGDVGIDPFDEDLAIDWAAGATKDNVILSARDKALPSFSDYQEGLPR